MARTRDELKAAVDSMCRVRAVESPADAKGVRRVWHRGTRGAELVTDIDATGKVLNQELVVFDEALTWKREGGLGTGSVRGAEGTLSADGKVDAAKVARAAANLQHYAGNDRLLTHLREKVLAQTPRERRATVARPPPVPAVGWRRTPALIGLITAGLAIVLIGLYLLFG